jgi:hypothetical protein
MKDTQNELWLETRLNQEGMDFLHQAISEENKESWNHRLVGNISKSEVIKDKDNWFFETTLKALTEKLFYRDWNNYCRYHIEKEEPPKFELEKLWVNHQKQHEFNPLPHVHIALYSFVVFMKIPTHWEEQHTLPFTLYSGNPCASDFQFMWTQKDTEDSFFRNFKLSPEDEGRMLFFPSSLQHQVFPFYGTEEERITISGNIRIIDTNKLEEISLTEREEKENILKVMENGVNNLREILEGPAWDEYQEQKKRETN